MPSSHSPPAGAATSFPRAAPPSPPKLCIPSNVSISGLPRSPPAVPTVSLLTPPHPLPTHPHAHLELALSDTPHSSLLSTLPHSLPFLYRHHPSPLVIHCLHGTCRSPATLIAFLLYLHPSAHSPKLRVKSLLTALQARSADIDPSASFVHQLAAFAERNPSPHSPTPYQYPSRCSVYRSQAGPLETQQILRSLFRAWPGIPLQWHRDATPVDTFVPWHDILLPNPEQENGGRVWLRCRKCRASLAGHGAQVGNERTSDAGVVPVWPNQWMGKAVVGQTGRLRCPGCGAKVGGWRWGTGVWMQCTAVDRVNTRVEAGRSTCIANDAGP